MAGFAVVLAAGGASFLRKNLTLPPVADASLSYQVTRPNMPTDNRYAPYATTIQLAVADWPEHYNFGRYEVLIVFTTTHSKVVSLTTASPSLASGGWFKPGPINAKVRAQHLATLPSGVVPNGVPTTWYVVMARTLHTTVTASTLHPVRPSQWRIVVIVLQRTTGGPRVAWAKVVSPGTD